MSWTEPKTDWNETDRFNISDFNRIKNNLAYLCDAVQAICGYTEFEDMGNDINYYEVMWDYNIFNAFESNLDIMSMRFYGSLKFGNRLTFYPNGQFIQWKELNRIEKPALK